MVPCLCDVREACSCLRLKMFYCADDADYQVFEETSDLVYARKVLVLVVHIFGQCQKNFLIQMELVFYFKDLEEWLRRFVYWRFFSEL